MSGAWRRWRRGTNLFWPNTNVAASSVGRGRRRFYASRDWSIPRGSRWQGRPIAGTATSRVSGAGVCVFAAGFGAGGSGVGFSAGGALLGVGGGRGGVFVCRSVPELFEFAHVGGSGSGGATLLRVGG